MRALWLTLFALVVDQAVKLTVVHNMMLYESIPVLGSWLKWTYTTNPGMAFGITLGAPFLVTAFALIATALIVVYLRQIRAAYAPYRYSLALILGGALGNIVDRVAYGKFFGVGGLFEAFALSPFPYTQWFRGQVVDFFHVDVSHLDLPIVGTGLQIPIWNVADMAIVAGVIGFILFQGRYQREEEARQRAQVAVVDGGAPPAVSPAAPDATSLEASPKA